MATLTFQGASALSNRAEVAAGRRQEMAGGLLSVKGAALSGVGHKRGCRCWNPEQKKLEYLN